MKPNETRPKSCQKNNILRVCIAVTVDVARRWHGIKVTPADLEKLNPLRQEVAPLKVTA